MLEFYAPWCGACQAIGPEYHRFADVLEKEGSDVKVARIDATKEHGERPVPSACCESSLAEAMV